MSTENYRINVYSTFSTIERIADGEIVAALYGVAQKLDVKIRELLNALEAKEAKAKAKEVA